jgi:hypothetical protein
VKITFRAPVVLTFRSRLARNVSFVLLAALRAAIIAAFVFAAYLPYPLYNPLWLRPALFQLAKILFVPIYYFGVLVPPLRSPLAGDAGHWVDYSSFLRQHMMAGIAAYLIVFHLPALARFLRTRFARKADARV